MNPARYLIDTSALVRLLRKDAAAQGWDEAANAGLIAICPITQLEFLNSARSLAVRQEHVEAFRDLFCWVPIIDQVYERAAQTQEQLTRRGEHRSAGAVDLVLAATAELHDLALLHQDRDFDCIAAVTGQPMQWLIKN